MIKKIKNYVYQFPAIKNLVHFVKTDMDLMYRPEDLNDQYYQKAKISGGGELEHQIGRLTNYKNIISEIESKKLSGDIIEFGTWQGFSLLWIAYFIERTGLFSKKIIGIDGFVGLPNGEGVFPKGGFSNTSLRKCKNNFIFSRELYPITKRNVFIEKFLYSQKEEIRKRLKEITSDKFCFIHIDCDISSSVKEIFEIIKKGDILADTCYLLFDDYGSMNSYKNTVDGLLKEIGNKWIIKEHSNTVQTKNFLLQKR